ncbi:hypothetical protein DYB32_002086 [Aphanomyces invadans]|uniref:C2 domain-containing protein n=1 Tax=Aphanomyces invadans TaxID=157072 RepID=A0A3R6YEC2_9STRA|nr:hypothetical protein DYB32_002086 [Aphanomyces invadans]
MRVSLSPSPARGGRPAVRHRSHDYPMRLSMPRCSSACQAAAVSTVRAKVGPCRDGVHDSCVQRGRAARSRFRTLALKNETTRLRQSPLRGYMLYARGSYYDAALLLEQSFLAGYADDENNDEMFWVKFGTAHFYSYEATGDRSHLEKALAAFQRLFPKASDVDRPAAERNGTGNNLSPSSRLVLGLVYATALFFNHSFGPCLALCDEVLNVRSSPALDKEWVATAHVLASNVCFFNHKLDACAAHLAATIALGPLKAYSELALRYMLATVYALLSKQNDTDVAATTMAPLAIPTAGGTAPEGILVKRDDENVEIELNDRDLLNRDGVPDAAVDHADMGGNVPTLQDAAKSRTPEAGDGAPTTTLERPCRVPETEAQRYHRLSEMEYAICYSIVELWPDVGYASFLSHGRQSPGGTFLVHRIKASSPHVYIKVKWDDGAITTMKVTRGSTGDDTDKFYRNPNSPDATDTTLVGFLSKLPRAAGISLRQGLRCRQSRSRRSAGTAAFGVDWTHWEQWYLTDHAWLHAAHLWDQHSGYVFSNFLASTCPAFLQYQATKAAQELTKRKSCGNVAHPKRATSTGWHTAKRKPLTIPPATSEELRAQGEACLVQAKAARGIGKLMDSLICIQNAVAINPTYECIRRSWSSKATTNLAAAMRRVQKLDRLWSRALAFDTYTPSTRGQPQAEALLLECIYRQHFHALATVDVHRRLVRAHIRAYCMDGFDLAHLDMALRSMDALADAYRNQHASSTAAFPVPVPRQYGPSVPSTAPARRILPSTTLKPVSPSKKTKKKMSSAALQATEASTPAEKPERTLPPPEQKGQAKRPRSLRVSTIEPHWPVELLAEMAEVTYRSLQITRAVDSLYALAKRISNAPAYTHLFRNTLVRLAFLLAHRRQFDRAVRIMTHLLHEVDAAPRDPVVAVSIPKWPVAMPFEFSTTDVRFMRGVVMDMAAEVAPDAQQRNQEKAWADFAPLHNDLVRQVQKMLREEQATTNSAAFRETHVSGVVVTVGECHGLHIPNILVSNVRVVVVMDHHPGKKCHSGVSTADPPSWETMQPNWNDQVVSIPASTKHSTVTVLVVNKVHLRDVVMASMTLPLSTLFACGQIAMKPWRLLSPTTDHSSLLSPHSTTQAAPTLGLAFQLTTFRPQFTRDDKEKRDIAFALGDFLNQPFVWHSYGARFVRVSDHFLARHFLLQALRRVPLPHDLRAVHMMLDVARCDLACRAGHPCAKQDTVTKSRPASTAVEWLQKAHVAALMLEPRHIHVENAILDVMQQAMMQESPFERKLDVCMTQPLEVDYIAVTSEHGQYFVNKETGDCILDEPLGYEAQVLKPPLRRMVVFSDSMKQRVLRLRREMKVAAAADSDQWVAMYDEFHCRMFYVSQVHSMQSYTTPARYVMVGDEMTVYRCARLLFLRETSCVGVGLYVQAAWRARVKARAIRATKVPLTCLKVIIHRAEGLRAADRVSSDPFVQLDLPGCKTRRTAIRKATLTPEWDEVFHMRYTWLNHELAMQQHQALLAAGKQPGSGDGGDDGQELEDTVNLRRVRRQLEHNLALNDGTLDGEDNASERDQSGDDDNEEKSVSDNDGPMLTLTVYDYDAPSRGNVESSSDFLGLATVPVDALDHGKAISAALTLRDEDGYLSPRPRGTLDITVQWIPRVFPIRLRSALVAVHAIARMDNLMRRTYAERRKTQAPPRKPKPTMSDDERMLLELITSTWHDALVKLADAIVMADQLQRLMLRLQDARKSHTNAEEEEHIERRLNAVMRDQFGGKRQAVDVAMGVVAKGLRRFARTTMDEVVAYVGSGTDVILQEKIALWFANLGYVAGQSTPRRDDAPPPPATETYDCIMQFVLSQKEKFVLWETSLRGVVEEGFVDGKWAYDMSKELAICRKIEATLGDAPTDVPHISFEEEERIKQRQHVRAKKLEKQKKRKK